MTRYQLTIQVDTVGELTELVRLLVNQGAAPAPQLQVIQGDVQAPLCPNGHGALALRPAGTVKSGPRIGQPYPAFWRCPGCDYKQNA